jgi:hypothetical protein
VSVLARAGLRLVLFGLVVLLGAQLLRDPYRGLETAIAVHLLNAIAGAGHTRLLGNSVLLSPAGRARFVAVVTPACSSLPSVLCLLCVTTLLPGRGFRRAISASLGVGLVAGRASLVLFHDSVGTIVTFASTLAGFIIMLMVLLPGETSLLPQPIGAPCPQPL